MAYENHPNNDDEANAGNKSASRPINASSCENPSRLLIIMPNWVGDVVMATPALRALRNRYPETRITLLLRSHLSEILAGGDWMDDQVYWPSRKGKSRSKRRQGFLGLAAELREQRFEWAVLLSNAFRSALLARLAGIRRRIGYDRDGRGLLLTDKLLPERYQGKYLPTPMIRYYNAIARYLGCRDCPDCPELFTTPQEQAAADTALRAAKVKDKQAVVVLNPGASFGPAKRWPAERFAGIGDALAREYGAAIFISCGPREIETARAVASQMKESVTVLDDPVMPLGPSKALIRRANLLVTNDTGPRHFANAFGTPVITIFGPTHQEWTTTAATHERMLQIDVDCGPCMKRKCPTDHRCMTGISTEAVLEKARELLAKRMSSATT